MHEARSAKLKTALEHILYVLRTEYHPEKVILFGSVANDTVDEWSDIDLVIIKKTSTPFIERSVEVALLCRVPVGVDYLVYTPYELEQMINQRNPFILNEVLKRGKVLYEREPIQAMA